MTTFAPAPTLTTSRYPRFVWLLLDDLRVDNGPETPRFTRGYQRHDTEPSFKNLRDKICAQYDAALLHPLDVACWDNFLEGFSSYWVYDGYCRLEAVRMMFAAGLWDATVYGAPRADMIFCAVIDVDRDEQSTLFLLQTHRRGVQWPDKHNARLTKNDPAALAIEDVCRKLSVTVGRGKADIRAIQACYSTIEIDRNPKAPLAALRPDLLQEVLYVAGMAWDPKNSGNISAGLQVTYASSDRMIDALALLLSKYPAKVLDRAQLIKALSTKEGYPPLLVTRVAKKTSVHGSNNKGALAVEILGLFNKSAKQKLHKSPLVTTKRKP